MNNRSDSDVMPGGPYLPCLKEGESTYNFTPEALSALLRKAYHDGYQFAKSIYYTPLKETDYGS
jgi:hypothetical protein